jgi:hypothetical protein
VIVEPEHAPMPRVSTAQGEPVTADAVTGSWAGDAMTHYALDVILQTIGAFEPTRPPSTDVSAETSQPLAA